MKTKIIILFIITLTITACVPKDNPEVKELAKSSSGNSGVKKWAAQKEPIILVFSSDRRKDLENIVQRVIGRYNDAIGRQVLDYRFEHFKDDMYFETSKNRVFFQRGVAGEDTMVNVFERTIDNEIYHADIVFDETYDLAGGDVQYSHSFESAFVHALGHFLGEDHIDYDLDPDSVMLDGGDRQLHPILSKGDVKRFNKRYSNVID